MAIIPGKKGINPFTGKPAKGAKAPTADLSDLESTPGFASKSTSSKIQAAQLRYGKGSPKHLAAIAKYTK
jgi:hypothetical protein